MITSRGNHFHQVSSGLDKNWGFLSIASFWTCAVLFTQTLYSEKIYFGGNLVSCFLSSLQINRTSPRTLVSHHLGTWQLLGHGMSNWPSPFFPNTTLFSARDTWPNRILFLVNWCRLDFWCIFSSYSSWRLHFSYIFV